MRRVITECVLNEHIQINSLQAKSYFTYTQF